MINCPKSSELTSAHVQRNVRLRPHNLAPLHELISTKPVGLNSEAGDLWPRCLVSLQTNGFRTDLKPFRPVFLGTDAVHPVIRSAEVAARVANDSAVQLL